MDDKQKISILVSLIQDVMSLDKAEYLLRMSGMSDEDLEEIGILCTEDEE